MGTVKDIEVSEVPTPDSVGRATFRFTDRYSVFDWGEMPERIDGKGEALALMGAYTFEELERRGIETHYLGVEEDGEVKGLDELEGPTDRMHVKLVNVLEPEFRGGSYDYSIFRDPPVKNYLIPLEVIYRNGVPRGSSARERYSPGELGLDMDHWPEGTVFLEEPIIESSTKLEEQDRYLDGVEAEKISGVSLQEIYGVAMKTNEIITRRSEEVGMEHDDGKLEFLYIDDDIVVGDVAGTFDEDRFTFDDVQVSKEVLRQAYKRNQPDWVKEVKGAKERAREEGIGGWKHLVTIEPQRSGLEELVSEMYRAGANRYVGKEFFEVRDLAEVAGELRSVLSML